MTATRSHSFIRDFTVDLAQESKSNIEPFEGESNRIADSWNRTTLIDAMSSDHCSTKDTLFLR